jgi:hypothetical protein
MADDVNAVNDNTNAPQPQSDAAQQTPQPAAPANDSAQQDGTLLGGNGSTDQKDNQPAGAPEAYDFKASIPEGVELDETITKEFSDIARGMNLTNEQANQMAAYGIKYGQQVAEAINAQFNERVTKWGEAAKADMGANFNTIMSTAGAGLEAAEKQIPGIRQALNETGAGNRIEVIKLCEMLGKLVQADPGKLVNVTGAGIPREDQTWYPNSNMK